MNTFSQPGKVNIV